MNLIAPLLSPTNVLVDVAVTSKKRVFEQASLMFENHHGIARSVIFDSLFAREKLGSTGLGHGAAVPHGRIRGLSQPVAGLIRLSEGIAFDAPDGKPVSLLIFLLVPEQASQQHLEILAEVAQLIADRQVREALFEATSATDLHALIQSWDSTADITT